LDLSEDKSIKGIILTALLLASSLSGAAEQTLEAVFVEQMPMIDGTATETSWQSARSIQTFDPISNTTIEIRALYNDDCIAILVEFDDADETRSHKPLVWDNFTRFYRVGAQREDAMVFKWNMDPFADDISLQASKPYKADIWYWKAHRGDHSGFADDKYQVYSKFKFSRKNKLLANGDGNTFYFSRHGDAGRSTYSSLSPTEYIEDNLSGYQLQQPSGSRADVRARGQWKNNRWTIEFLRNLDTGNIDDVKFDVNRRLLFGVSRYEIAARKPDPTIIPPEYGSGEVNDKLYLVFRPGAVK
jgi:hypothetical protein